MFSVPVGQLISVPPEGVSKSITKELQNRTNEGVFFYAIEDIWDASVLTNGKIVIAGNGGDALGPSSVPLIKAENLALNSHAFDFCIKRSDGLALQGNLSFIIERLSIIENGEKFYAGDVIGQEETIAQPLPPPTGWSDVFTSKLSPLFGSCIFRVTPKWSPSDNGQNLELEKVVMRIRNAL